MKHGVIGMDFAKQVLQLHSVDPETGEVERIKLRRDEMLPLVLRNKTDALRTRAPSGPPCNNPTRASLR